MVDALRRAHRAVKHRGLVIDARPDASRVPRVLVRGRTVTKLVQSDDADRRDGEADRAVAIVKSEGLFRSLERGWIWHRSTIGDLRELDDYVRNSSRYAGYERGGRARTAKHPNATFALRRAVKFEVLERV